MNPSLRVIGTVHSPISDMEAAPKQGFLGGTEATIELDPAYADGLDGLAPGEDVLLLTWLQRADREALNAHPQGDATLPKRGVFGLRSPMRPNPIGLHRVQILSMDGATLRVAPLEVLNGTPLVDIKPVLGAEARPALAGDDYDTAVAELLAVGQRAWQRGLVSGFNGNLSVRLADRVLITASGCQKGLVEATDVAVVDAASGKVLSGPSCSSETPLHLAVYHARPDARAIVHVHPPKLLALSLKLPEANLLKLALYEADVFAAELGFAPALEPGSEALAQAAAEAARNGRAVLLHRHGLVCVGATLLEALGLAEELESLAAIQLASG